MIQETQFSKKDNQFHSLKINYQTMDKELQQLDTDLSKLETRLNSLEVSLSHGQQITPKTEQKKKRRTADLVDRAFPCPYPKCQKMYGTEISLNLHIRLKHNGGSKIEREELAVYIVFKNSKKYQLPNLKKRNHLNIIQISHLTFSSNFVKIIRNSFTIWKQSIKNKQFFDFIMYNDNLSYKDHLDAHIVVKNAINHLILKVQHNYSENLLIKYIPISAAKQTIEINNLLISQQFMFPQEIPHFFEDQEPPHSKKESFSSMSTRFIVEMETQQQKLEPKPHTNSINNKMKKSTVQPKQSKPPLQGVYKVKETLFTQDETDDYYRNLHDRKQQVIEQMYKNQQKIITEQQEMQSQLEQIKKKYQKTTLTYDVDGSILPINQQKQKFEVNIHSMQAKVLNKKLNKALNIINSQQNFIKNPLIVPSNQQDNYKFEDKKQVIGPTKITHSYDTNVYQKQSRLQKFKTLMHDQSLRLTKKQFVEAVNLSQDISQQLIKQQYAPQRHSSQNNSISKVSSPILKKISQNIRTEPSPILNLKKLHNQGSIQILKQNQIQELLIQEISQQQIICKSQLETTQEESQNEIHMISFSNKNGELPQLSRKRKNKQIQQIYQRQQSPKMIKVNQQHGLIKLRSITSQY